MSYARKLSTVLPIACALVLLVSSGCESYFFLPSYSKVSSPTDVSATDDIIPDEAFEAVIVQERTFTHGTAVSTVAYDPDDLTRTPLGVDFNDDGKIDPVVGYEHDTAVSSGGVVQILLSNPNDAIGTVNFTSLTLDGNNGRWKDLMDVAVGDIDSDGQFDIVAATSDGVVYLRHPAEDVAPTADERTRYLRGWLPDDPNTVYIAGTDAGLTNEVIESLVATAAPVGFKIDDWEIQVTQGYTNVELADLNGDGNNDIAASHIFNVIATPKPEINAVPFFVQGGGVQLYINPGGATNGLGWVFLGEVGRHETLLEQDRQGVAGLQLVDMDNDGDFDILSAASYDANVQIAWFENPGFIDPVNSLRDWVQWRIGSVRGAFAIDYGDLTGDGRPDVVASGSEQMQLMLFEQPAAGPKREYDWDTYPIVTFASYMPRDVRMLDIDQDGALELVVGGTVGALRYFESPLDPRTEWTGQIIADFESLGTISLFGYGDLDGDTDLDLVLTLDTDDDNQAQTVWMQNNLSLFGF